MKNLQNKCRNRLHYNTYYSNIHTWTDNAPAAKTDKQGQKEKYHDYRKIYRNR